ncbi:MAG: hypothetical protein KGH75_08890 [Rhodospirillales bacterium]|nr:hypothetical protein [Rhodospirillales bacterium]
MPIKAIKTGHLKHAIALAVYGFLSFVLVDHGVSITRNLSGQGSDPYAFLWFLAWWPHAVMAHLSPIITNIVWYPVGVSLAWLTAVPALSFMFAPLTALAGPVVSYNVLVILSPILCAWFAYLVCFYLTSDLAASLIGGFLFGFSTYEMAQDTAALNLSTAFCVPALLLIILRRLDGSLSRKWAVGFSVILLTMQFYICIEVFATIFVFGGIAWMLGSLYAADHRPALRRLVVDAMFAAPFVTIAVAPFLIPMAYTYNLVHLPAAWPYYYTADLLNLIIPSQGNLFGWPFLFLSHHFNGGVQEQDIYLGLPLLLLIWLFALEQFSQASGRLLIVCFLVFLLCSFGPWLWIGGHFSAIALPWLLAVHLPLLGSALPTRFALFVSLTAAIIAALWLAGLQRRWARFTLGLICCITLLPRPHPWSPLPYSAFFAPGRVQALLGPNPRILILPFAIKGPSSYWQMENHFGFTQIGGYVGFPPEPMQKYPAVFEMFANDMKPSFVPDFVQFCQAMHTQYVIVGQGADQAMVKAISGLNWPTQKIDDVTVIMVPSR